MESYLYSLIGTFCVTYFSLLALKPVAEKVGLMDEPGERKIHDTATPMVGGLGIYLSTALILYLLIPDVFRHYLLLLSLCALLLFVGAWDDLRGLSVRTRFYAQIAAVMLMCVVGGNQLTSFGNLYGFGSVNLGILSIPITVLAGVGIVNAINMSDGMDGLSAGLVTISLSFLGCLAYTKNEFQLLTIISILICALCAFLLLNFRLPWKLPALIYLGDSGSTFLGFSLAWFLIESTQGEDPLMPPALALWFIAIPLLDTVYLLIQRVLDNKSPFQPGTDHLHHRLLSSGYSLRETVLIMYGLSVLIGALGFVAYLNGASERYLFASFVGLFIIYFLTSYNREIKVRC